MDAEIKKAWIDALRSGEYEQTTNRLHGSDGFCCLGVLCDVAVDGYWEWSYPDYAWKLITEDVTGIATLPYRLQKQLGLSDDQQNKLIKMNDCEGKSFKQIANYIQRYI